MIKPKHVSCAQHDSGNSPGSPAPVHFKRALQNCELSDEPVQQWQPDRRQHDDHEQSRVDRHYVRHTTELLDFTRMTPLVDKSHDQEERARGDSVIDLLDDAALQAVGVQGEDTESAKAKVADG